MKLSECKGVCSIFDYKDDTLQHWVRRTKDDIELSRPTNYTKHRDVSRVVSVSDLKDFRGGIPLP